MKSALIFAAGLGTRLKPLTDTMPKALVPYEGKPLLEHCIRKLQKEGFDHIVINIHHFAQMIKEFVAQFLDQNRDLGLKIEFSDETDLLRDTGGGIKFAAPFLVRDSEEAPFLVHNVDIISNLDLNTFYKRHLEDSDSPIATLLVSQRETSRYFLFDSEDYLVGWINKSTKEIKSPIAEVANSDFDSLLAKYRTLAFGGMHIISPRIFPYMNSWNEKFSIVDFYLSMVESRVIKGFEAPDGTTLVDVGKLDQLKLFNQQK